jgi:hypothetical protein
MRYLNSPSPRRFLFWTFVVLLVGFVALQAVRPAIGNPPVTAEIQAPPEVKRILERSCYNCHSNQTKLPWFDQVVPAYWLVASDVKEARKHLNFSTIGALPAAQQKATLFEAVNMIQLGAMPLPSYRRVHPDAAITPQDLATARNYLLTTLQPPPAATNPNPADAQYQAWIHSAATKPEVAPSPNGIAFPADYKNWKAISGTDRIDNNTILVILGNDIAIRAIAEHHMNPWPDGTTFAKVAWYQQQDSQGIVHPGTFAQVEFMIRDSQKYHATNNWGWARWRGVDLKPYGKNAAFSNECMNCHAPMAKNDFVFTMPLGGQQ